MSPFPTPFWKVNPQCPEEKVIAHAASIVEKEGIVIYPTETFYGMGGNPKSNAAAERIYQIKGRNSDKPVPLIAADMEVVLELAAEWPPEAQRLAELFWPGPLTLVLPTRSALSSRVCARTGKIAVRISSHPVARALSAAVGGLLISTSANFANHPPNSDPREISPELIQKVDGLLDAGRLTGRLASTIVDVSLSPAKLVRMGCISRESISSAVDLELVTPT